MQSMTIGNERPTIFLCDPGLDEAHRMIDDLAARDFDIRLITQCSEAEEAIVTGIPDAVVLDVGLPVIGGYEVCRKVRPYYNGLIIIKGEEGEETAQLLAFERGADDYVVLPASPALFAARIKAHLRRQHGALNHTEALQIRSGDMLVDATRREVRLGSEPVELTALQFELLWYLAKRSGRVIPREELYGALYHSDYNGFDRSVDVHISRIRHQLGDCPDNPTYVKTVRGVGYLFVGRSQGVGL